MSESKKWEAIGQAMVDGYNAGIGAVHSRAKKRILDLIDGTIIAECGGMFPDIDLAIDEFREKVAVAEFKEGGSDD